LVARIVSTLKPEQGETKVTLTYLLETSSVCSQGGGNPFMTINSIPEYTGKILLEVKNGCEKNS
jgi:hypothetical protein